MTDLPINAVLPDLLAALDAGPNAVLVAPPGAGKTTAVAPALLDQAWCTSRILLLSPRRIAARAAAERIAELAGEAIGGRIGYATRLDSKQSAATRLLVITQGIFVAMIQADPELAGISAVLFDEVHERSLDGDFGLALALDAQAGLRPDLRLVAMSATLAGERFSALMGGAPVIESAGRSFPIEHVYLAAPASGSRTTWPPRSAARWARRREGYSPSCPAWPRSSAPPSDSALCRRMSRCIACMARSIPRSSGPRSGARRPARANWCWRHPSQRPA